MSYKLKRIFLMFAASTVIVACTDSTISAERLATNCYQMPSQTSVWDVPTYMTTRGYPSNAQWQKTQQGKQLFACYRGLAQ